jgi:RNA polymerase sigma factor (sigma-70 family)
MTVLPTPQTATFGELELDHLYEKNLAIVYGYAFRLCGGDLRRSQDLTQEAWTAFVEHVREERAGALDVDQLIAATRTRHVDTWRRARRRETLAGLEWSSTRESDADDSVTRKQVVDRLIELDDDDRLVLMLRYVDAMEVDEIAATLSGTTTATYSLLARARDALRRVAIDTDEERVASKGSGAVYEDLAIEPAAAFEIDLGRRLHARLRDEHPVDKPAAVDDNRDIDPATGNAPSAERGKVRGTRRLLLASALALVAAIGAGALVAGVVHDDSETASPAFGQPTTTPTITPTTSPPVTSDEQAAALMLLSDSDADIPGLRELESVLPITLDGAVAARLPACRPFAATVFESESRPAAVQDARFISREASGNLMLQYVAVLESAQQATAMVDGIRNPAFLADCVPAYRATNPAECCPQQRFPFYLGEDLAPPTLTVDADDVWVRRYDVSWIDKLGNVQHGPQQDIVAAVHVGRIVTIVDLMLIDFYGEQVATVDDFDRILDDLAVRAAAAQ